MKENYFSEDEKQFVLDWMQKYCYGREYARFRENSTNPELGILPFMPKHIYDRKWRMIISVLIQEAQVYSSASFGYFFMPLAFPSPADIEAAISALVERKAKALATIEKVDINLKKLEGRMQGVRDFFPANQPNQS